MTDFIQKQKNDPDPDLLRRMEHAVDYMNRQDRWVFLCHVVHELSYREIATRGRISIEKVEQAMMRALCHMSKMLDDDYVHPIRKWWQFWKLR